MPNNEILPGDYWYTGHASSKKARDIHSININGINTWDEWHLIPSSRPVVNPPSKKETLIDIPGANGVLDESESLTKFPVYSTRQGSWEFYVDNDYGYWETRRTEIMDAIHGLMSTVILDDDPSWYYTGTVSVNEWQSNKDRSTIVLDYNLYPYKLSCVTSIDQDWLWDPFNFETDQIYSEVGNGLNEVSVNKQSGEWHTLEYSDGYFRRLPVSPEIIVVSENANNPIKLKLDNPELEIVPSDFDGGAGIRPESGKRMAGFTLSSIKKTNKNTIYLTGEGTVSFKFRVGRL